MIKQTVHIIFFLWLFLSFHNAFPQNNLIFQTNAVDAILVWMQNGCNKNNIDKLADLPGNQIMEQLYKGQEKNIPPFRKALDEFTLSDTPSVGTYLLNDALKNKIKIAELLNKIKSSDFSDDVFRWVIEYFPKNYAPPRNYEVFLTATGWKWGDAMSFSYIAKDGKYVVSDTGKPAIIFNLTLVCMTYGNTMSEQMDALKDVMSHELFHAIFADYIKSNWQFIGNNTLYMMLNEGLAHYISDGKLLQKNYNKDEKLKQKEKEAFASLSDSAKVIFNREKTVNRRRIALNAGLFGKYWNKYICISGMFMAFHIEQYFGTNELIECVKNGPVYFIKKYEVINQVNKELPVLPEEIIKLVK